MGLCIFLSYPAFLFLSYRWILYHERSGTERDRSKIGKGRRKTEENLAMKPFLFVLAWGKSAAAKEQKPFHGESFYLTGTPFIGKLAQRFMEGAPVR